MKQTPNCQPISNLSTVAYLIDGELETNEEQYENFLKVEKKPYVLDDATVERAIKFFTEQVEFIEIDKEQLDRWQKEKLTAGQEREIVRLLRQVRHIERLNKKIMTILDKVKDLTIDKIMKMDANERILKVLRGEIPFSFDEEEDEEDYLDDKVVPKLKQEFFYVITNRELNQTSLPDFVFPEFSQLFDMMEILDRLRKGWQVGRIPVEGDFFVSRQPYLRRFIKQQAKSLKVLEKVFKEPDNRPTSKMSAQDLKMLEKEISWRS